MVYRLHDSAATLPRLISNDSAPAQDPLERNRRLQVLITSSDRNFGPTNEKSDST